MRAILLLAALVLSINSKASAQQWSAEQLEVWQTVTDCWDAWVENASDSAMDCFHEDYSFWWAESVLPFGKDLVTNYWDKRREGDPVVMVDVQPAAIIVHGDVALVQWGARAFTEDHTGKRGEWAERASMTLVKENGRWQYLGGGGSPLRK